MHCHSKNKSCPISTFLILTSQNRQSLYGHPQLLANFQASNLYRRCLSRVDTADHIEFR